ncbi:MAG: hypothetical protein ACXWV0_04380 [Flavisolibacter sp.]
MANKIKVLIAHRDLTVLSRIYLALLHRNYRVEATDNAEEMKERITRLKPALVILGEDEFLATYEWLKLPLVLLSDDPGFPAAPMIVQGSKVEVHLPVEKLLTLINEVVL